jgi:hypothetical protein
VLFFAEFKKNNNNLEIAVDSKIEGLNENEDVREEVIIKRIIYALNINDKIKFIECDIIPQYQKGELYIPMMPYSRISMHDIVMISPFISKIFAINEQFTTFSKRGGISLIYLPSDSQNKNDITTCSLSNGIVSSSNKRFAKKHWCSSSNISSSFFTGVIFFRNPFRS